ncbi:MBL fold metallo-hydrolase [Winogradskyella sp. A3E31]|uniref:MBL fold metallo-hydrolase n=1 Tax=Winogradskyella sp. A3E31 TaxID=3349637 RepID=UPI00398AE344
MKFNTLTLLFTALVLLYSCKNDKNQSQDSVEITEVDEGTTEATMTDSQVKVIPINHGTLVLETEDQVIYVDPVGGAEAFEGQKVPTMVLITDIHGDHLNVKTLEALNLEDADIIVPQAIAEKLPEGLGKSIIVLDNGKSTEVNSMTIEAIPMYNLREEAKNFHTKGRGNGYVLNITDERVYISGDTEDIPEMRNLKDIDKAFICMNLPYTMTVQSAASAVIDFKPKEVYPYHYRGKDGLSDVETFKSLVNKGTSNVKVVQLGWYN